MLHNVPDIQDVRTMQEVLEYLGRCVEFADGTMTVDTAAVQSTWRPYELVQRMRASIQIMGPLVARFGQARVAMPGGCNLGPRKIDIHLRGLAAHGGEVRSDHGFVEVVADQAAGRSTCSWTIRAWAPPRTCSWPRCWPKAPPPSRTSPASRRSSTCASS